MNDSRHVFASANEMRAAHQEDLKWIKEHIHEADVVVTHHVPSLLLISDEFKDHKLNSGFVTPGLAESFVSRSNAAEKLWVCGHTHRPMTANLNGFGQMVVNPFGYPGELESCPPLVVSISRQCQA